MGEHLASEGHGGSAGVLFNEVEDRDAQRWGGVGSVCWFVGERCLRRRLQQVALYVPQG